MSENGIRDRLRHWAVPVVTVVMIGIGLAVLWLGNTTAYQPGGRTRCGPALQELPQLFGEVAGRCHLARQDRLQLGLRMAGAMTLAGAVVWGVTCVVARVRLSRSARERPGGNRSSATA